MKGRSKTSNSFTPSGPNLASDGASICTAPSCSASISSLSLYSVLLGYTSTLTRPWVAFSASSLKRMAAWPFGVFGATTWLNLITIGVWANALALTMAAAESAKSRVFSFIDVSMWVKEQTVSCLWRYCLHPITDRQVWLTTIGGRYRDERNAAGR